MDVRRRGCRKQERATTTLEHVEVAVAVAVLLGGIATGMGAQGGSLGSGIGDRISAIVSGDRATWRWRDARERRTGGGTAPVRVSRDELRMEPLLPPLAMWADEWKHHAVADGGATLDATASACALCASLEWSRELAPRATAGSDGPFAGLTASIEAAARVALASAEVGARAERRVGSARAFGQGRLRATIGGEADAAAEFAVARDGVTLDAEAGAMAGAVARAEAKVGIDLLGVAIRQSGRIEGWAGAGIRGTGGVRYDKGVVTWRVGWGAALGLGGAGEWSGQVDATGVSPTHRRLARDALAMSLRAAGMPVPYVALTHRSNR